MLFRQEWENAQLRYNCRMPMRSILQISQSGRVVCFFRKNIVNGSSSKSRLWLLAVKYLHYTNKAEKKRWWGRKILGGQTISLLYRAKELQNNDSVMYQCKCFWSTLKPCLTFVYDPDMEFGLVEKDLSAVVLNFNVYENVPVKLWGNGEMWVWFLLSCHVTWIN